MDHASDLVYLHSSDSDSAESFDDSDLEDDLLGAVIETAGADEDDDGDEDGAVAASAPAPSTAAIAGGGGGAGAGAAAPPAAAAEAGTRRGSGLMAALRRRMASAADESVSARSSAAAPPRMKARARKEKKASRKAAGKRGKYRRKIDTNILSLSLGRLAENVEPATGDVVFCENCNAAMSNISKIYDADGKRVRHPSDTTTDADAEGKGGEAEAARPPADADPAATAPDAAAPAAGAAAAAATEGKAAEEDSQTWTCEFCARKNGVTLDPDEVPISGSVDYMLEPPAPAELGRSTSSTGDDNLIVFCIDISGSMCVTSEMRGKVSLKGDKTRERAAEMMARGDAGDQFMPGESRDVTWVSRLQCVQAAVAKQIEALKAAYPGRKVALVTFNNEVVITGDGTSDPRTLAGDRLTDYGALVAAGAEFPLENTVSKTADALVEKVYALEEGGSTALGPAVVAAVAMAARKTGSKVVVCTDGLANVGLGAVDELESKTEEERAAVETFYDRVGTFAASKGVTVDVIGIEGEGCDLENLGRMAEAAGGDVEKVNPLELATNFASVLANPVLATNVQVSVMLHAGMRFREEPAAVGNKLVRDIGNVTKESDVTFQYGMKSHAELRADGVDLAAISELPFQVQIRFTKLDGAKYVRILSQAKPVTRERAAAEEAVRTEVVSTHAAQQSAMMAKAGDYTNARVTSRAWTNMLTRTAKTAAQREHVAAYATGMTPLDSALRSEIVEERSAGLEMEGKDAEEMSRARSHRRHGRDGLSKAIYKAKKKGTSSWA